MRFENPCSSFHFSWDACMSDWRWFNRSSSLRYLLSRARTGRLFVSFHEAWSSLARWSTPSTSLVTQYCSSVTAVPSFSPLPSHAVWKFPRNGTNPSGVSPANCRRWTPRCPSRYRCADSSPLNRGSTTVSSRCSCRTARSASCTRARCGRLSATRARRRRRVAPGSLPEAETEVELRLLSLQSAPLESGDESDGLGSLSVDEGGPEDGGDASRRERRRRRFLRVETSLGRLRTAAHCDCARVGRSARLAATVKVDPFMPRPPAGGRPPDVPGPGPGSAGALAPADAGDGPSAAVRAMATAALRDGTRAPSNAAVDASSAASRNTWARWRRCPVLVAGRDAPWAATPPVPWRLGPAPPSVDGASSCQRSRVVRYHWARATSFGVTPKALCSSRRCRSSSAGDS